LAVVAATNAASAVDDLMLTIKISEGYPLNMVQPWNRPIPLGSINKIIFKKNQLALSPEAIEVTADESGVTVK
ncbi:hypothetical protein PENTCL1PPCAC_10583, partial [Pristionchus entomophagus]